MAKVFHRYLVYITRDIGKRVRYPASIRLCNNGSSPIRLRLKYVGPFTKIGLENYVKYVALIRDDILVSNENAESNTFEVGPGECIDFDLEYEVSNEILDNVDFARLKMIEDGLLSVGGFQFDVITED